MFSKKTGRLGRLIITALTLVIMFFPARVIARGSAAYPSTVRRVDTDPYSMVSEVNALRAANGLPGYSINPILMAVAQRHAEYMAVAGVTHYGADGSTPWQRGLAAGYPLAGDLTQGGFYSENITAGRNKSVQDAVSGWQGDAPHLNTMLSGNLTEIGVGVAIVGDYVYYVIDCARPTSSGQPQAFTQVPGELPAAGGTAAAGQLVVKTIVPSTPMEDGKTYHVVKPGETLWLIAISYGVKVADLRRLNNLAETQSILPGYKLFIQLSNTLTPVPPTSTATALPTSTPLPTATVVSTATPTASPVPAASIPVETSTIVVGIIVIAALVLAAVIMRSGKKS